MVWPLAGFSMQTRLYKYYQKDGKCLGIRKEEQSNRGGPIALKTVVGKKWEYKWKIGETMAETREKARGLLHNAQPEPHTALIARDF